MDQNEKLDLILDKLHNIEANADRQNLKELAKKYWKLTDNDVALIELSRKILDRANKNNDDKTLAFLMDISDLVNRVGEEGMKRVLLKMSPREANHEAKKKGAGAE